MLKGNTFRMTGVSGRQVKNVSKLSKCFQNVKIIEFHNYNWNQHLKCIQISPNMPGIGLVVHEKAFEKTKPFCMLIYLDV